MLTKPPCLRHLSVCCIPQAALPKLTFVRMTGCPKLLAPPMLQDKLLPWVAKVRSMPSSGTYEHGFFEVRPCLVSPTCACFTSW